MPDANAICNENQISSLLEAAKTPSDQELAVILQKASKMDGLDLAEVATLLMVTDEAQKQKMFETSHQIKNEIYGERLVFFAPLYISSYCVNDCDYCGFHARNKSPRKKLALDEVREQVKHLVKMGHKRVLLEFGEHPLNTIDYVCDVIRTVYDTKHENGEIRRANVNIAATSVEDYRKLKEVGIGTYQLFQETYHRDTYYKYHRGPKADYERQIFAHDRAFEAGLDDVGIGALFGLYDHKFEVLALVAHADYLEKTYGCGPHTISVPRFQPADSVDFMPEYPVSEADLLHIISVLRMAVPYTGMIISTRERPEIREKAFELGISQTSAASETAPGGYSDKTGVKKRQGLKLKQDVSQFKTADHRTLNEVVKSTLRQGLLPSFCTACYREGRTGEDFMHIAKPGEIHNLCRPNALLTFQEYLEDYGDEEVKTEAEKIVIKYINQIDDELRKQETLERLDRIRAGERDLYF